MDRRDFIKKATIAAAATAVNTASIPKSFR